jgi:hypothetical protein
LKNQRKKKKKRNEREKKIKESEGKRTDTLLYRGGLTALESLAIVNDPTILITRNEVSCIVLHSGPSNAHISLGRVPSSSVDDRSLVNEASFALPGLAKWHLGLGGHVAKDAFLDTKER